MCLCVCVFGCVVKRSAVAGVGGAFVRVTLIPSFDPCTFAFAFFLFFYLLLWLLLVMLLARGRESMDAVVAAGRRTGTGHLRRAGGQER